VVQPLIPPTCFGIEAETIVAKQIYPIIYRQYQRVLKQVIRDIGKKS
jgi:hypothetical protein